MALHDDIKTFGNGLKQLGEAFTEIGDYAYYVTVALDPFIQAAKEAKRLAIEKQVLKFNQFWFGLTYSDRQRLQSLN